MRVLCIGDIVSAEGREILQQRLGRLKREYKADLCIVNGENAALGNGIDRPSQEDIFFAGADVITGGNHSFQKKDSGDVLEETENLLRPANLRESFGRGFCRVESWDYSALIINLQGMLYLPECDNPFVMADEIIRKQAQAGDIIIVDFHAEASSEKQAMGYYLDGRASLVFGTHTHVQTADEQILSKGTGYITDIGMTGAADSVLGKAIAPAVHNFVHWGDPEQRQRTQDAHGRLILCGIFAQIDDKTKKCVQLERIRIEDNLNK